MASPSATPMEPRLPMDAPVDAAPPTDVEPPRELGGEDSATADSKVPAAKIPSPSHRTVGLGTAGSAENQMSPTTRRFGGTFAGAIKARMSARTTGRPEKRALGQTAQDLVDDADGGAKEPPRKKRKGTPASPDPTQAPAGQTSALPSTSRRPGKRSVDQTAQESGDDADGSGASEPPKKKRKGNPASQKKRKGSPASPASTSRPSVPSRRVLASGTRTCSATQHAEARRVSKLKSARETAAQMAARREWQPVEGTSVRLEVWMRSVQVQVLDNSAPQRAAIISDGAVLYLARRGVERYWGWEAVGWRRGWVVGLLEEK